MTPRSEKRAGSASETEPLGRAPSIRAYPLDLRKKIIEAVEPSTTSTGGIRCATLRITLRFEQTRPEADAKGGEEWE